MGRIPAVLSLSGGMDSATLFASMIESGRKVVRAVGFCYGSKHNSYENAAAANLASHYSVPYDLVDLNNVGALLRSNLLRQGGPIPEGHYEAKSMEQTVVPGRNLIFASILSGLAWSTDAVEVWMGVHSGDHAIYPDCRPDFVSAMAAAIHYGTDGRIKLMTPFLNMNKNSILEYGLRYQVPYILTRTCYKDQPVACGKCGSCQERLAAFAANGLPDPIEYESREIVLKEV